VSGDTERDDLTGPARLVHMRRAIAPALRGLLEDRFQLQLHRATEEQSMYALTVARGGLRIAPISPGDCWTWDPSSNRTTPPPGMTARQMCGNVHGGGFARQAGIRRYEYTGFTVSDFCVSLSNVMDRYVLDRTGIAARFNIVLEFAPDDRTPGSPFGGAIESLSRSAFQGGSVAAPGSSAPSGAATIFKALEKIGFMLEPTKGRADYLQIDSVQRPRPDLPAPSRAPRGA
jgi:uncharacterized protein (TIGR03435 family)